MQSHDNSAEFINYQRRIHNVSRIDQTEMGNTSAGIVATAVQGNVTTITAPATKIVNGKTLIFAGWSDGESSNPRTVTPIDHTTYTALYKGSQLATSVTSNSKPNQQKIVQTANGWLHRTYESMGRVWYEAKPPTGDWQIIGDGAQLSLDGVAAKSPSISVLPSGSGFTGTLASAVMITWQVDNAIKTRIYHPFNGSYTHYLQRTISTDLPLTSEPNPAIAWSGSNEFIIVWASPTGLQFGRYKILTNPDDIGVVATGTIGGTDSNSRFPSVATDMTNTYSPYYDVA